MRLGLVLFVAVLAAALVRFALARPAIEARFARKAAPSAVRRDLARFDEGPVVRVSSVDWARRSHPGYLVDGWQRPSPIEKWASGPGDFEPWAEVQLDAPREIDEVALGFEAVAGDYRIDCFSGARAVASLPVRGNSSAGPHHALSCPATDRVRVSFGRPAQVFELELWGK